MSGKPPKFLIVGAGFSGAVLARQLVETMECHVEVWDERDHLGGNCHTERDSQTGVMVHRYGPHIFNTNNDDVWAYVKRFGEFRPYVNRVKAVTSRGVFSMPINLLTINQFFGKAMGPDEARRFILSLGDQSIAEPATFEEQALKMMGRELYETFFRGYTLKQWGVDPRELPASVLNRLPIRFNYDDNYYDKKHQGIPVEGYTGVIANILDHPAVTVTLGKRFVPRGGGQIRETFNHRFYTGPIDAFFNYSEGRLGYRTVNFERVSTEASDYQGAAVINYTEQSVPWTRIHEHKHFAPWEEHDGTAVYREYSRETGSDDPPFYPKRLTADLKVLGRYREMARSIQGPGSGTDGVRITFLGRLATYRYMDMEAVIGEALQLSRDFVAAAKADIEPPVFPNME